MHYDIIIGTEKSFFKGQRNGEKKTKNGLIGIKQSIKAAPRAKDHLFTGKIDIT